MCPVLDDGIVSSGECSCRHQPMKPWPGTPEELAEVQRALAAVVPPPWHPPGSGWSAAGCFVCFARGRRGPGTAGEPGWAAAALMSGDRILAWRVVAGTAGADYLPGLLALRDGPLLEAAILSLPERPDVLIVNATGRDHARGAGLALHLGERLDVPSVGVTHRPLIASGSLPADEIGATSPLRIGDVLVAYWVRSGRGLRPLAVHAAWRTTPEVAVAVVLALSRRHRTPEPLRAARRAARDARAASGRA